MKLKAFAAALAASSVLATGATALDVDPSLPAYKSVSGISGQVEVDRI